MQKPKRIPKASAPYIRSIAPLAVAVSYLFSFTNAAAEDPVSAYDYFRAIPPDLAQAKAPEQASAATAPLPVAVDKSANGVSVRTGLSTLRDYNAKALEQRIKEVKGRAPANLKLPKAAPAKPPPLNVWTKFDAENGAVDASQTLRATLGADYKLSDTATAGISAQQSDTEPPIGGTPVPTNRTYSAYMNLKASSMLSVDAKTQWQRAESDALAGIAERERNSFSLAPKVEQKFDLGDGLAISPYATVKHQLDINAVDGTESATSSAGGGVTLSKPDTYSVTVSTDVQQSSGGDTPSVNSKLQLKVPLP